MRKQSLKPIELTLLHRVMLVWLKGTRFLSHGTVEPNGTFFPSSFQPEGDHYGVL